MINNAIAQKTHAPRVKKFNVLHWKFFFAHRYSILHLSESKREEFKEIVQFYGNPFRTY